jgi:hypothetical protein
VDINTASDRKGLHKVNGYKNITLFIHFIIQTLKITILAKLNGEVKEMSNHRISLQARRKMPSIGIYKQIHSSSSRIQHNNITTVQQQMTLPSGQWVPIFETTGCLHLQDRSDVF